MKKDYYVFNYSTKTRRFKVISYGAYSLAGAIRRFKKNVRYVGSFSVYLICEGFGIWLGLHD